jgi:hypothetical protein
MDDKDLKALLAYLQANSPLYPLEALRAQMVKAGHAPEAAEQAIAVFQGRLRPPEPSAWPLALGVALIDLALVWVWAGLFQRFGTGRVSCSGAVLLPVLYLGEIVWGLAALTAGKDRRGRGLLLGLLLFLIVGLVILSAMTGKWLSHLGS